MEGDDVLTRPDNGDVATRPGSNNVVKRQESDDLVAREDIADGSDITDMEKEVLGGMSIGTGKQPASNYSLRESLIDYQYLFVLSLMEITINHTRKDSKFVQSS